MPQRPSLMRVKASASSQPHRPAMRLKQKYETWNASSSSPSTPVPTFVYMHSSKQSRHVAVAPQSTPAQLTKGHVAMTRPAGKSTGATSAMGRALFLPRVLAELTEVAPSSMSMSAPAAGTKAVGV